jgi:hypothetical protein
MNQSAGGRMVLNRAAQVTLPTMAQVLPIILRRERASVAGVRTLLVSGALLSLLGPICVGTFLWLFSMRGSGQLNWVECFSISVLVVVPLLYAIERWTRGTFLEDNAERFTGGGSWFGMGIAGRGMVGILLVEIWLWGPRMVYSATSRIGQARGGETADRKVAAAIICKLLAHDGGLPAVQVLEGIAESDSVPALAFLLCYEWVGISKDGTRIWLDSTTRKLLEPVTGSSPSA